MNDQREVDGVGVSAKEVRADVGFGEGPLRSRAVDVGQVLRP